MVRLLHSAHVEPSQGARLPGARLHLAGTGAPYRGDTLGSGPMHSHSGRHSLGPPRLDFIDAQAYRYLTCLLDYGFKTAPDVGQAPKAPGHT